MHVLLCAMRTPSESVNFAGASRANYGWRGTRHSGNRPRSGSRRLSFNGGVQWRTYGYTTVGRRQRTCCATCTPKITAQFAARHAAEELISHYDLVHVRSRLPAWLIYRVAKVAQHSRPRLVTTVHGRYSVNRYSEIMTKGERVIAISKNVREYI